MRVCFRASKLAWGGGGREEGARDCSGGCMLTREFCGVVCIGSGCIMALASSLSQAGAAQTVMNLDSSMERRADRGC